MTKKDRIKWARKLKPFWETREKHMRFFRIAEESIEFDMKVCLKEELEFFYIDGECVGIGHKDSARRKKGKNYFPLINDTELED